MTRSETGYVVYPGTKLYYEVDGDGPALTLIHAGVAHLRMWDAQVAAFKDRYTVVRYDERGFGQTQTEDVPYSNAGDLLQLLDHLAIDRTHLVGNSRGGSIALDFALAHPDRVRSLTLVGSGVSGFDADDPRLIDVWPEIERLWEAKEYDKVVELETQIWTDGPGQPSTRVDPEMRRRMVDWNLENYKADQEADQVQKLDPPAAGRLGEVKTPTMVIWGRLDTADTNAAGEKMAAEIRGAKSHVFPDVAHMVSLEKPAEFNTLLADFLAQVEAGAS
ncbi:MAG TPA: alpha/beta fold hydrolase [Candidatus Limnocylindrales bacterium]